MSSSFGNMLQQPPASSSSTGLGGNNSSSSFIGGLFSSSSSSSTTASNTTNNNNGENDIESQSLLMDGTLNLNNISLSSMRSTLESQLPQKVLGMNYQQRFQVFCISILLSCIFFALGFFVGIPLLTVRPQKFAISFTFGSITFLSSFAILKGPQEHFSSMMTYDRIHFTLIYLGSMMLTLYLTFTVGGAQGYLLVLGSSLLQLLALFWYLVTFLPGGAMGMKMLTQALWTMLKPILMGCAKVQAMCISRCVSWYASSFTSS